MDCENCKKLSETLKSQLGRRLTRKWLESIGVEFEERIETSRTCHCGFSRYAKGLCYRHYMAARRNTVMVNDLGQHIGRKGKVLCDAPGCDYDMIRRDQGLDGKWYCAHHLVETNQAFKAKEPE